MAFRSNDNHKIFTITAVNFWRYYLAMFYNLKTPEANSRGRFYRTDIITNNLV